MHSELPDTVNTGKMPIYHTFYIFSMEQLFQMTILCLMNSVILLCVMPLEVHL